MHLLTLSVCLNLTDIFAVVPSRLTPAPSNTSKYQRLCSVSGQELLRRIEGPEALSASVLGQMLMLGKGSLKAKSLKELLCRLNIKRRTSSANLSSFSIQTECMYLFSEVHKFSCRQIKMLQLFF